MAEGVAGVVAGAVAYSLVFCLEGLQWLETVVYGGLQWLETVVYSG